MKVSVKSTLICQISNINSDATKIHMHDALAKHCDPYVPFQEGVLSQETICTPDYCMWQGPYAHYQYEGIVYGPSFPVIEDGVIVGWKSPPKKYPTNRQLEYNKTFHPLATHHWDQQMMRDKKQEFMQELADIVTNAIKGKDQDIT